MSGNKVLVVLGATGTQGRAVLRHFVQHYRKDLTLRGVIQSPSSQASQDLQALGIDMVNADFDDLPSLYAAFEGATHVFANTHSNQHSFHAMKYPEVLHQGQTPLTYALKIETRQGKDIVGALAATTSLKRVPSEVE
ncbi:hypothetical protein LTR17_013954 [Elasticomyces elasticus]|nr:hypothetical protein LTR17_013954 [Elasticomyces elasticus]